MEKVPKSPCIFFCQICDYKTCKKHQHDKHLLSSKHKSRTISNEKLPKTSKQFICKICEKTYKSRNGLWYHEQKCQIKTNTNNIITDSSNNSEFVFDKEFVMSILKQNAELQNQMMEVIKNGTHNTTNNNTNTNTNSHNKTFNLQFFLNETCKDAMNITDFVDSLKLQLSDLEKVGDVGYIEGISSIIIKNLNALDVTERPIHCTDKKRETMYIKDEDKWEKDDDKRIKMHKMVKKVANKNINMISEFQKMHPEYKKCSSRVSDQYNKIVIESMGGKGDNDYEKEEKIIKKIAKEVFVDKGL
jgi:hypothetical protein